MFFGHVWRFLYAIAAGLIDVILLYSSEQFFFHLFFTNMFFVKSFSDFGFDGTGFCLKTRITYYVEHLCAAVPFSPSLFFTGHKSATIQLWQLFQKKTNKTTFKKVTKQWQNSIS